MRMHTSTQGSALITLLAFMSAAIIFTTLAVAVIVINQQATLKYGQAEEALVVTEGGAENALMRLIRDPTYAGETLAIGNGTTTSVITGSSTRTITVDGTVGNFHRRIQIIGTYNNAVFKITSWTEI